MKAKATRKDCREGAGRLAAHSQGNKSLRTATSEDILLYFTQALDSQARKFMHPKDDAQLERVLSSLSVMKSLHKVFLVL